VAGLGDGERTGGGIGLTATAGESSGGVGGLAPGTAPGWTTDVAGGAMASGRGGAAQATTTASSATPARSRPVGPARPPRSGRRLPGIARPPADHALGIGRR
jgi:hypothetical protein